MNDKPHILFITTSSLATNPRLVKEFEYLKSFYVCTVICFIHDDWSLKPSQEIIKRNANVDFIVINRHKKLLETLYAKFCHKLSIRLNPFFKSNTKIAAFASNDKTPQLIFEMKRFLKRKKVNRIIAHNLGAFYPALKGSKWADVLLQLDVEDYHPGEELYFNEKHEYSNRLLIMQQAFNKADAITFASEGIKLKSEEVFDFQQETKTRVITNAFTSEDFKIPKHTETNQINLVWFSQNISPKRGLEAIFEIAKKQLNLNFHLIGKPDKNFIERFKPLENIIIHGPMDQTVLHGFLSTMDIGLALENKDSDGNRDICLTNKILAYAQAGLYIMATDTFGQRRFLEQLGDNCGVIIKSSLEQELENLNMDMFNNSNKLKRWKNAKAFSWEKERESLLEVMK